MATERRKPKCTIHSRAVNQLQALTHQQGLIHSYLSSFPRASSRVRQYGSELTTNNSAIVRTSPDASASQDFSLHCSSTSTPPPVLGKPDQSRASPSAFPGTKVLVAEARPAPHESSSTVWGAQLAQQQLTLTSMPSCMTSTSQRSTSHNKARTTCRSNTTSQQCCHPNAPSSF